MRVHVSLAKPGEAEPNELTIDGHDITSHVLAENFAITLGADGGPIITLALRPDILALDIDGPAGDVLRAIATPQPLTGAQS